jgi:hypothetical protein
MSCCGRKRQALRAAAPRPRPSAPAPTPALQNPVSLTYLGDASIVVNGAHTRLIYLFGPRGQALTVDERDVPALIATGWFAPA